MSTNEQQPAPDGGKPGVLRTAVTTVVALGVLTGSGLIAHHWLTNRPRAGRRRPESRATLVDAAPVQSTDFGVEVDAMGTVTAARDLKLASRVSGEIVDLSPELIPGGLLKAGQAIATIDQQDYELAVEQCRADIARLAAESEQLKQQVAQRAADVKRAESDLKLETGRRQVAREEFDILGEEICEEDREFVLREPQRASAEAALAAAQAAKRSTEASCKALESTKAAAEVKLRMAQLDLERTKVRAPFNAVVSAESAELGAQVSPGTVLATLVGTDQYWVELSVPVDNLKWINIPRSDGDTGSMVRVFHEAAWGPGRFRTGRVKRLAAGLESSGRMARLIVEIDDPLCLKPENADKPSLILGSYLRAVVEGSELKQVVSVPRTALRDGNRAWVVAPDGTLDIREVEIVWRAQESVCVSKGLHDGEEIVTSDLAAPVQGMALRVKGKLEKAVAPPKAGPPLPETGAER